MIFKIKSFPCSGSEFFESLVAGYFKNPIYCQQRQIDLSHQLPEWRGEDDCFLKTHENSHKKEGEFHILIVRHPLKAIRSFAGLLSCLYPGLDKKKLLEESLYPSLFPSASWKEIYEDFQAKADMIIHLDDLIRHPREILERVYERQPGGLVKSGERIFWSQVRNAHRLDYKLASMGRLPKWYDRQVEAETRQIYCAMGFKWIFEREGWE